eukprot:TRINITY_DN16128_c0_g1_i1.p1 TRINITY_DN16128_c0_g1~~TRINITY_DN16128_c0_g1_i1.p1  ORF type:complete len:195 (-),score=26.11 TRINITY_DN16128_c0_g1_i1:12-596(-)
MVRVQFVICHFLSPLKSSLLFLCHFESCCRQLPPKNSPPFHPNINTNTKPNTNTSDHANINTNINTKNNSTSTTNFNHYHINNNTNNLDPSYSINFKNHNNNRTCTTTNNHDNTLTNNSTDKTNPTHNQTGTETHRTTTYLNREHHIFSHKYGIVALMILMMVPGVRAVGKHEQIWLDEGLVVIMLLNVAPTLR